MSIHSRFFVIIVMTCLLSAGCSMPGPEPIIIQLAPTETIDFSDAKATLTIVHNADLLIGKITISGAIPLFFGTIPGDPQKSTMVWGKGTGTGVLDSGASGTGGSYAVSADIPVQYEVRGILRPSPQECLLELTVDETLLLSQPIEVYAEPLGTVPMVMGEDMVSTFPDLLFTETDPRVTNPYGIDSVLTVDDWCLPAEMHCTSGCTSD